MALANEFSLDQYDCIGFDLDHTICKYNLPNLYQLIFDSLSQYFAEIRNYPRTVLKPEFYDPNQVQKGIILDKKRGNLLKLDKDLRIIKAYHGSKLMSEVDIVETYGPDCVWEELKDMSTKMCAGKYLEGPFYVYRDYFSCVAVSICSKILDCLDKKYGSSRTPVAFAKDYIGGLHYIYDRNNYKNNTNYYYPEMKKNPEKYIEKCDSDLKEWLRQLRCHKKIFLVTGSNADIAEFLLKHCFGDDWPDYFDSVITYSRKPLFFTGSSAFKAVRGCERHPVSVDEMQPSKIYAEGNASDLVKFFKNMTGIESPKILYVGDSLIEDVYAPSNFSGWDSIAIVEELFAESGDRKGDSGHLLQSERWGSFFTNETDKGINQTYWANMISSYSRIAIPSVSALLNLSITDKIPAFSPNNPYAGYYPSAPQISKK